VHWFISDERFVPQDDPLSNFGMARRAFLDACAPPQNIHPIRTDVASPDESARLYEIELRAFGVARGGGPLFDLVLLGAGPDGHTASLFPGFPATKETKHWVVGVPQANVAPFVPRVSLTLPCLASANEMLFLASGHDKMNILARVFADDDLPAAHAHSANGETIWLIDEAAAPPNAGDHPHGGD
jgi:6-phosphogluconolactonase